MRPGTVAGLLLGIMIGLAVGMMLERKKEAGPN
jgi:hypothetical protein